MKLKFLVFSVHSKFPGVYQAVAYLFGNFESYDKVPEDLEPLREALADFGTQVCMCATCDPSLTFSGVVHRCLDSWELQFDICCRFDANALFVCRMGCCQTGTLVGLICQICTVMPTLVYGEASDSDRSI